jgi:Zn-dependent protease
MDMEQNVNGSPNLTVDLKNDLIPELKIINSNEGKFSSLTLLIVTVIFFFSAQIISTKWQEIVILIAVLLFHELGHLAAMKLLRYNDVKMFFIPFIGAAVSGKSRNDTAVKSCIVSLMGPFPGILLGTFLYVLFLLTKNYFVFKTAQVMLLLNAFNFLPIMPLDGGRYIDVLFINRRYFRFLFAFFGAAIFLLLASAGQDIVLGIIGFITVYVALSNFKLHGISNDLRSKGIKAASVNDLIEDENALQIVIAKLQDDYPKLFKPKMVYRGIFNQMTVIVDTIKFVPARFLPKLVLLATYAVLVSASILVTFFFIAANYKEIPRIEEIDGKKQVYVERHLFGRKKSECPINVALYYDGKGTGFEDDGSTTDVFYYANGYRTGEWLTFGQAGKITEKRNYETGRLVTISKLENGTWKTYSIEDMSFLGKCSEEIQRLSQPYRSNYKYF